ncbi:MAG: gephyrin-like molybdotransferase Glp, partial [Acidimicrobiales bacterium]
MIPLAEARSIVLDRCPPRPPVWTPVDAALGCVTARPVVSAVPVPPFDNSAVDGYAVRAADVRTAHVVLDEVAAVMAGTSTDRVLG